jgi:anti-sigma-K factor RskA
MSTDLHTLSGAYALDALSPEEAEAFDQHLADCPSCREEVQELRQAASRMGEIEATRPPSALRARVLAAADQQAQLPPKVTPIEFAAARRWTSRLGTRLVGAAAAVLLVIGGVAFWHGQQGGDQAPPVTQATSVSEVLKAPDVHVKTVRTADGHSLQVASSAEFGQLAVATKGLRRLSAKQVYQMWTVHNGRSTSAGLISDLDKGKVMAIPTYGTAVAITVEPAGGSEHPTSKPIVKLDPQTV